jgi:hypothetical protein
LVLRFPLFRRKKYLLFRLGVLAHGGASKRKRSPSAGGDRIVAP